MRRFFNLVAIWLTLGSAVALSASDSLVIDLGRVPDNEGLFLGSQVSFWENQKEPLNPAAMVDGQYDSNFQPSIKDVPGSAYVKGEIWVRLVVRNPEILPRSLVLESRYALTDRLSLYQKDLNGQLKVDEQGDRNEYRPDPYAFRSPTFSLMAFPGENIYYLRAQSRGPNILSLFLWRDAGFKGHRFVDTLILGGLFGFILSLFFYNSFLALSLRSRTYTYYSIFLLNVVLLQISMQNMWPYLVKPSWASWLENEGYVFIGSLTNFSALVVTIAFLSMKKNLPGFLRYFQALSLFSLSPFVVAFFVGFDTQARLMGVNVGMGSLAMIVACVAAILRGYQPAAYYLLASLTFLAANILLTCNLLGIYHSPHVIQYGNFFGVVVQGLLMSLAIGHRVQFIRSHADKVIRGLNHELQNHLAQVEALVAERTETIRTILDNVASGFVIVDPEGHIVQGFSRSCRQLLGQGLQEGQLFADVLELDASSRKIWTLAWTQIFQDLMPAAVSLAQLPSSIRQGQRSLHLESKILRDEQGRIKNLLFTIQDVTELKRQKRQAKRHRVLIKILQDLEAFRQFIHHSYEFIARLKVCTDKREQAFLLHTLKGNSMVFGLHAIARRLHQLEESRKLTTVDLHALENLFRDFLEKHQGILKTNWSPTGHHETRVTTAQLKQLEELIEERQEAELTFAVSGWIQDVLAKPVGILVQPIVDNARILAQRLNRQVDIQVTGSEVRVRSQQEEKAMEFLVHIMRNAIVHGMDEDRVAQGKSVQGQIHLEFSETHDTLRVTVRDDGRGFDRRYWEEKAREMTVKSDSAISRLSWVELIEVVSRGGHSTQKLVSMEAGRGVGLEGVIQAVRDLGGHIHLVSDSGRGSSVEIEIKRRLAHEAA